MNARRAAALAVVALAFIALGLFAVIVFRDGTDAHQALPVERDCDVSVMPGPLFPAVDDTPVLLWPEGNAKLTLDGAPVLSTLDAPRSFPPGEHTLNVECADKKADRTFVLEPYRAAAVFADCKGGAGFTLFGADGDDKMARTKAMRGPKDSGLRALAESLAQLERQEEVRLNGLFIQRWNAVTERYGRVRLVVGREAAGASDSANERFEALSKGFQTASGVHDAPALDASIRAAEETLRVLVRAARLARPHDCEFQQRLTQAF